MDQEYIIRTLRVSTPSPVWFFFHASDNMNIPPTKKKERIKTHIAQKDTKFRICNIMCALLVSAIVFVIFCVLKLIHVLAWEWVWITAPLWMPISLIVGLLVFILVMVILIALIQFFQSIAQGYRK